MQLNHYISIHFYVFSFLYSRLYSWMSSSLSLHKKLLHNLASCFQHENNNSGSVCVCARGGGGDGGVDLSGRFTGNVNTLCQSCVLLNARGWRQKSKERLALNC